MAAAASSRPLTVYRTVCDKTLFLMDNICFELVSIIFRNRLEKTVTDRLDNAILRYSSRNYNAKNTIGCQSKALIHDFRPLIVTSVFFIVQKRYIHN